MAETRKSQKSRKAKVEGAVATVGMIAMAVAGAAGAYLGFSAAGLGAGFVGLLAGGAVGFGIVYVLTNLVRQNSKLLTLLLALAIILVVAWGLHRLGAMLGLNPG